MMRLNGLATIADRYDGFILDLWGVVHDGVHPFARALACMQQISPKTILLLSNAPRRAASVIQTLDELGIPRALYTHVLTSGEVTWQALRDCNDPWFAALGRRVIHLGPERDRGLLSGLELIRVDMAQDADFLLNTGPDDTRETGALDAFIPDLTECLERGLKMVCANPDLEIVRAGQRILCAGALAAWYEARGGDVRWIGKPDPSIYATALAIMSLGAGQVLAIGDSLRTDIVGAHASGIDSVWILGGIHAAELSGDPDAQARAVREAGLAPVAVMEQLSW